MLKLLKQKSVWRLIALLVLDAMLFGSVNVAEAASYLVIIGFVLLLLTIYYMLYNLILFCGLYGLRIKRKHQLALYTTVVVGILVALQSTGELGTRDIWVLLPLVILGYFYSTYARSNSL